MAERQETSVMVSIQEILRDAQNREEQEKVEAERRAQAEEQRRVEEARRRQEEEQARLRAEEDDRQRRLFEEQRRQAELGAMQEAAVQRARAEAEAQARLAEMASRQDHERQLHALNQDKHKKRLTGILVGLGAVFLIVAVGGGVLIKHTYDDAQAAKAQAAQLQNQIDEANAKQAKLQNELANTKDPEKIAELQAQLAEQQQKLQTLNTQATQTKSAGGGGGGGGAPRAVPAGGGGGAPKGGGGSPKPCNCTPGDPLCSCL
jgi:colicin import membrane protein